MQEAQIEEGVRRIGIDRDRILVGNFGPLQLVGLGQTVGPINIGGCIVSIRRNGTISGQPGFTMIAIEQIQG